MAVSRCGWATNDPLYIAYHDREWGSPLHDDRGLFELLILEGAQAGLSWITILRKRESYRSAFDDFEPSKIAGYGERKLAELLDNPGIIRNRLKIEAAVVNAKLLSRCNGILPASTPIFGGSSITHLCKMQGRAWATFQAPPKNRMR